MLVGLFSYMYNMYNYYIIVRIILMMMYKPSKPIGLCVSAYVMSSLSFLPEQCSMNIHYDWVR